MVEGFIQKTWIPKGINKGIILEAETFSKEAPTEENGKENKREDIV